MLSTREILLADLTAFLTRTGESASRVGMRAVGNHKVIGQLREGANIGIDTRDRLYAYMHKRLAELDAASGEKDSKYFTASTTGNEVDSSNDQAQRCGDLAGGHEPRPGDARI